MKQSILKELGTVKFWFDDEEQIWHANADGCGMGRRGTTPEEAICGLVDEKEEALRRELDRLREVLLSAAEGKRP